MKINVLEQELTELREALDGESSREKELKEQLQAYDAKITALNTILSDMMTNDRSGQVEKGLEEIIELLGGIPGVDSGSSSSSSSGTGGPGGIIPPVLSPNPPVSPEPIHHQGSKNIHKAAFNSKEVQFEIEGTHTDISARNAKIGKLIDEYLDSDQIYKDNGKINIYTTIVGKATDIRQPKEWRSNRTKIRNDLQKWQDEYITTTGDKPFAGLYQDTTNYGVKEGNIPDPFNIEFPMHGSKYFKPSTFGRGHDNKPKRKGGKKTRRKQVRKSKNKTIRYKLRKNGKQSKK